MPRRLVAVAATTAALVLVPSPASAHVVLERTEVAAGTSAEIAFRAPVEQPGTTNQKIYALIPGPVVVDSCRVPSAAWRCTLDTTSRPGSTFVTWETPVAGSPQDLRFLFTLTVPGTAEAQELKVPVVQTYSDGTVARWIDDGEPTPAPRLTVLARGTTPRTVAPTAPTHGGTTATGAPAAAPSAGATAAAAPTAGATSAPGAVGTSAAPVTSTAPADGADGEVLADDRPVASDGSGSGGVVALVGVVALAAAAAGGWLVVRRRRRA
jgi:periplasmic copper chaperone A